MFRMGHSIPGVALDMGGIVDSSILVRGALRPVITAWLLAGTLDGAAAVLQFLILSDGGNPVRVFQYIASGVFDRAAFDSPAMALWGVAFHYFIAFCWTLFYFFLFLKVPFLRKTTVAAVVLYGALIWTVMNLIVLPASKVARGPFDPGRAINGAVILMVCVAWPVVVVAKRHYAGRINTQEENKTPETDV